MTNARASADDRHIFFSAGASHLPTSALRASPRMVLFALNELRSCRKPKDPKGTTAVGRWKLREAFDHANRANRTNRARKPRKYSLRIAPIQARIALLDLFDLPAWNSLQFTFYSRQIRAVVAHDERNFWRYATAPYRRNLWISKGRCST